MTEILQQLKLLIIVGIIILIGQRIGYGIDIVSAIPGMLIVIVIAQLALIIKKLLPKVKFPAFAWATLISLLLSMPFMPTAQWFLGITNNVNFLGTTTPILAFAGLSVGNKLDVLKKMSWKIVIVAICVFIGTFFGSAIISQIVLKIQGII
ncbi:hypothetical protein SAMN02745751_02336 [Dethiosulfatibacter aminovorans DSM 17477]|uniref:DUF340 domain-containing protein n=1 Tax=Dethiosulfatibacter aminovorans DSM 17477 TaxID=1121476 RepID=A0A1M6IHY6_9FIRM|nr:hypothetical protein [Dethiosulfatibacter aminovorans]SHJ34055.1 hypothetical protein SAMN02745751_02336 [Dethiosulfatibacter aminovorans DSM 17477]